MSTIKERLYETAVNKGLSVGAFEEVCGLGRGNISNMKENGAIGSDKLAKIVDAYPDLDIVWLLTGKASPFSPTYSVPSTYEEAIGENRLLKSMLKEKELQNNEYLIQQGEDKKTIKDLQQRLEKTANTVSTRNIAHAE